MSDKCSFRGIPIPPPKEPIELLKKSPMAKKKPEEEGIYAAIQREYMR